MSKNHILIKDARGGFRVDVKSANGQMTTGTEVLETIASVEKSIVSQAKTFGRKIAVKNVREAIKWLRTTDNEMVAPIHVVYTGKNKVLLDRYGKKPSRAKEVVSQKNDVQ